MQPNTSFRWVSLLVLPILVITTLMSGTTPFAQAESSPMTAPAYSEAANVGGDGSLAFVPNRGQMPSDVHFQAHTEGGSLFLTAEGMVRSLFTPLEERSPSGDAHPCAVSTSPELLQHIVHMHFEGANRDSRLVGEGLLPGEINLIKGNTPEQQQLGLRGYGAVVYHSLYEGVDMRYEGIDGRVKGTYTVAPGANPSQIGWRYKGVERLQVDSATGQLMVGVHEGTESTLIEHAPVAWQVIDGHRVPVEVAYTLKSHTGLLKSATVGFEVGTYDPAYDLVIDPTIEWSTYIGGSNNDMARDVDVDTEGNVYVVGETFSTDFPILNSPGTSHNGDRDAFVTKYAPDGTMLYSTVFGGSNEDSAQAITIDDAGVVYIAGNTHSTNFPATDDALDKTLGGGRDAYIAKLDQSGNLKYATYHGGNRWEYGFVIEVGDDGDMYVAGFSHGGTPMKHEVQGFGGLNDGYITRIESDGSAIVYSTYMGGNGCDYISNLEVKGDTLYVASGMSSNDHTTTSNAYDSVCERCGCNYMYQGLLAKLVWDESTEDLSIAYSTYFGSDTPGTKTNFNDLEIVTEGDKEYAYLVGLTTASDLAITEDTLFDTYQGGTSDIFFAKMSIPQNLTENGTLEYSTYLGGSDRDIGISLFKSTHTEGTFHLVGFTASSDFPVEKPIQESLKGDNDLFVMTIQPDKGSIPFSTYLGGSATDYDSRGGNTSRIAVMDKEGYLYLAEQTSSTDFPVKNAHQDSNQGAKDGFLVKMKVEDASIENDLLLHYPFDAPPNADGLVPDASGSHNHGSRTGTVNYQPTGILGGAYQFTGSGYIQHYEGENPPAGLNDVTFSLWFKTAHPESNYKLASGATWSPGSGWIVGTHYPELWSEDGNAIAEKPCNRVPKKPFLSDEWNHLAVTYGTVPGSPYKLLREYVNGEIVRECTTTEFTIGDGQKLMIGAWTPYTAYNFKGLIDDFRIYGRALTEEEVGTLSSPASLSEVTPASAVTNAGDVPIWIHGESLHGPATVKIGSVELVDATVETSTTITAKLPAASLKSLGEGIHDVTVTNGWQTTTLPDAFTVHPQRTTTQFNAMVTMACDNDLVASCDTLFSRLEEAMQDDPDLNIIVLWDGNGKGDTAYYAVKSDGAKRTNYENGVSRFPIGEGDMANPLTYKQFAAWVHANYPSKSTVMHMVGHGGGWAPDFHPAQQNSNGKIGGMLWDKHPQSSMPLNVVAETLSWINEHTSTIDVLYLDAMHMGMVEVMAELAPHATFIVAHEATMWAIPYQNSHTFYLDDVDNTTTPKKLAKSIAADHAENLSDEGYPDQVGVINSSKMAEVMSALDDLSLLLKDDLSSNNTREMIKSAADNAAHVDENGDWLLNAEDSYLDLYDFANQLSTHRNVSDEIKEAANHLKSKLSAAMVQNKTLDGTPFLDDDIGEWNMDKLHGLSLYFPLNDEWKRAEYSATILPQFATATHWDEFIHEWHAIAAPAAPTSACSEANNCLSLPKHITFQGDPPKYADIEELVEVPIVVSHIYADDDFRGMQLHLTVDDPTILEPADDRNPTIGSFFPTGSNIRTIRNEDGWDVIINSPPESGTIVDSGMILSLPFYAQNEGMATLVLSDITLSNGRSQPIAHRLIAESTVEVNPKGNLHGRVYLEGRGDAQGVIITLQDGTYTANAEPNSGEFTILDILHNSYTVHISRPLYVSAMRTVSIIAGQTYEMDAVGLWAGDMNSNNIINIQDWRICAAASLLVGDLRYDINDDGEMDVLDCQFVQGNIDRPDMPTTNPPELMSTTQTQRGENAPSEWYVDGRVTLQPQGDYLVARIVEAQYPVYAVGMRLSIPNNASLSRIEPLGPLADGYLSWHQEGNSLYLIAEGNGQVLEEQIFRIHGFPSAEILATNLVGQTPNSGNRSFSTFLPFVAR